MKEYQLFNIGKGILIGIILMITSLSRDIQAQDISKTGAYTDLSHESKVFGHKKYYRIYLPQGYELSTERYPVIYFFHGWGGRHFKDESAKLEYEQLKTLVDQYRVILVMWDGNITEEERRPYNIGYHEDVKFQIQMKDYFPEFVSYIDSTYHTLTDRQHRGIIGFSMGGFMSFFLAGKYPDMVCTAVNLHGSPEFFVGYPQNHTLYPMRYTFKNLRDVQILLHNSTNDELYYLNEEVNKGAHWEEDLHYAYELFPGAHKIDDPGKTDIFEKAMRYVVNAFEHPVIRKEKWSHFDIYPDFKVWDYNVKTDKQIPGFVCLKNVNTRGFGLYSQKWLPDGPNLDSCNIELTTAPLYKPETEYNRVIYRKSDGKVEFGTIESNEKGELHFGCDGRGYEVGIYKSGDGPDIICPDYVLGENKRYIRAGQENSFSLKLFNRGGLINKLQKATIMISCSDSSTVILKRDAVLYFELDQRLALSPPLKVYCDKKPPADGAPSWLKIKVKIILENNEFEDELIIPVFFNVPYFNTFSTEDGYSLKDSEFGSGDGDGIAEPGENIMIYEEGHRTRLYTDDPYVEICREKLVDESLPSIWPDGYTLSSVIKISNSCPKGHVIELLANYETKSYMPINRELRWGKIFLKIDRDSLAIEKVKVLKILEHVADWQIANQGNVKYHDLDWTNAALYRGIAELTTISKNSKYNKWLIDIGWKYLWQPFNNMYMADDIAVSQMYLDMYKLKGDKRMLEPTMARTEWVINHPSSSILYLDYTNYLTLERWSWCDALFMAPPVYAQMYNITRELKYLEFMDKEYLVTYNFLYDKEEKLFFRDCSYFNKKESNGQKVFWGRGNGWVMGGLVKILQELPESVPSRKFYENLLVEMSEKVSSLQDKNGYWHSSLLDPGSFPNPETSCSGFFVYALAYGINSGLLDKEKYLPAVIRGWKALGKAVFKDGKLGWVQPVGLDPRQTKQEMTDVYGVGAFLMAGSEVYKLAE